MVIWSSLRSFPQSFALLLHRSTTNLTRNGCNQMKGTGSILAGQARRMGGGHDRVMVITASRWQWHKFKDLLHLYAMIGLIPVTAVILYANIFIGPAQLKEIPEGYEPKHWEYFRHPIQRWISRYLFASPQQEYEKFLHILYEEEEKRQIRKLEERILLKMSERSDYQGFYYRPAIVRYHRKVREEAEDLEALRGD